MADRFKLPCAVYVFFMRESQVLLLRRFNTGWRDGHYSLPAGHIDGNEKITEAAVREVREETGVAITAENLGAPLTMHRKTLDNTEYIDIFFSLKDWSGTPRICEPDKCDALTWFSEDALPENTLKYVRHALECMQEGISFTEYGWNGDAE